MRSSTRSTLRLPAILTVAVATVGGCGSNPGSPDSGSGARPALADVVSVATRGESGELEFVVGVASPDTGCERYADWWEIVDTDGRLIHRRVLGHSHVDEQPFVRSGGPVEVDPDRTLWVRAHMHPTGYGGRAMKGSVRAGFTHAEPEPGFAASLAEESPLPDGCRF